MHSSNVFTICLVMMYGKMVQTIRTGLHIEDQISEFPLRTGLHWHGKL